MANDPSVNPDFAGYNRVVLAYCDGNSFASNRDDPVNVTTTDAAGKTMTSKIFWRGKRLIDATLTSLVEKHGLGDAETVMLTGASAGGLAAYLHTDYVHEKLQELAPRMQKYRSAPISGYLFRRSIFLTAAQIYWNLAVLCVTAGQDSDCFTEQVFLRS